MLTIEIDTENTPNKIVTQGIVSNAKGERVFTVYTGNEYEHKLVDDLIERLNKCKSNIIWFTNSYLASKPKEIYVNGMMLPIGIILMGEGGFEVRLLGFYNTAHTYYKTYATLNTAKRGAIRRLKALDIIE